ncbi:hypothetical protein [Myxosarcina sp. GI1(2024)]
MSKIEKNLTEDLESLRTRINDYSQAWTTKAGEPDWAEIEQLYANEVLLHYDAVTPHSFANVSEMKTENRICSNEKDIKHEFFIAKGER